MKKTGAAVTAIAVILLLGSHFVQAGPGGGYGMGRGNCANCPGPQSGQGLSEEELARIDKFQEDTLELRKKVTIKEAELEALMSGENPDPDRVSKLTGEIFDLRQEFRTKAEAAGLPGGFRGGMGCGMGMKCGKGHRHTGMMRGSGGMLCRK